MKKIIMVAILILAFASIALAGEKKCDSVSKAEALWDYNMKSEALACLDEVIQADPTNAKAHFLKGKMCLATNDYVCAHERFSAEPVKAKYGHGIADLYKSIGDAKLSGSIKEAEAFYREASLYNPAVSKEVAKELFGKGTQIGNDSFLYLAGRLDPSLNKAIGEYYSSQSKVASRKEDQIDFLGKAASFDNTREKEYIENREAWGRFHLDEGKKWAKVPGKEQVTDDHRQAARKYLGDAVVEQELPEVRKFSKGEFDLGIFKAGEQTPYRIDTLERSEVRFKATNRNIKLVFKDGREFCLWKEEDKNKINNMSTESHLFKIVAVADVDITLVVK